MSEKTLFTKIINREIKSDIIYEDELAIVIKDINPQSPLHFLIIPVKPIPTINDIKKEDKELIGHLIYVGGQIAKKYKINEDGYRLVINCNKHGQQTVYHLHIHLIGGRQMSWPPG